MQPKSTSNIPGESVPSSVSVDESRVVRGTTPTPAPVCPTSLVGQTNITGGTAQGTALTSPPSVESETDVNAFAEAMVKHMESQQMHDALVGSQQAQILRKKTEGRNPGPVPRLYREM